ncbi:hypothetical protein TNCV_1470141 [Trichonephila clavipes]|nr:hypothetical protein TNCV_1470141 [Trichonephila clavipes]
MELTFFPDRKPHPIPPTEHVWALFGCAVKRTLQAHAAEELESAAGSRISPDIIHYLIDTDKAWLYYYDPTIQQQSSEWKHPSSPTLKKAKTVKSAG